MRRRSSLLVACATIVLPVLLLVYRLRFVQIRKYLEQSFDSDFLYISCDLVLMALMGMSILVAGIAIVFIASKHPEDRLSKSLAIVGLILGISVSAFIMVMGLLDILGADWSH